MSNGRITLYHFTQPGTVLLIASQGLQPNASEENGYMTHGEPVVWLTRQPSNILTAADVAHIEARGGTIDPKAFPIGGPFFGGPARVQVELARHDKRLIRYIDFVRKHGGETEILRTYAAPNNDATQWFIYRSHIPAHKVSTLLPRDQMVALLDWHIETHTDRDFAEGLKPVREQVSDAPPEIFWEWERGDNGDLTGLKSFTLGHEAAAA